MTYQAKFQTPFGALGIRCDVDALREITFLEPTVLAQIKFEQKKSPLATEVCKQLAAYFADAAFKFNLPLNPLGTPHQSKVWQAISAIPLGQTRYYGDLAKSLHSSARAVGGACGSNPIPIIIPCHRVLSKSGLGGFMQQRAGQALDIKRWLLDHEQR